MATEQVSGGLWYSGVRSMGHSLGAMELSADRKPELPYMPQALDQPALEGARVTRWEVLGTCFPRPVSLHHRQLQGW